MSASAGPRPIPEYLLPYIVRQDPSLYTAIDHASWRFIMKLSQAYFAENAHKKYLDGLRETGVSTERIPLISEMDQKLQKFGWRAVPVSGFIPPAVFMEFLSLGILPIAADMRTLEHLAYTPAPDIVHEAAGHAPILADPEYASYLHKYGELARKAIFSSRDQEVYEAIRSLSDIKENPRSTDAEIDAAQKRLDAATAAVDYVSEATELARMSWWTIEYGLVMDQGKAKIYGAGLLSSMSESFSSLNGGAKHVPFSLDCIHMTYDITRPQPQLYVARDFQQLVDALAELGKRMAFSIGGLEGLGRAWRAGTVTTTQLDTGLQISGKLVEFAQDPSGAVSFVKYEGPVQLSQGDRQIEGQGADYHKQGFSSPLGRVKGRGRDASTLTEDELKVGRLEFESGVVLEGKYRSRVERNGRNLIVTFDQCRITHGARTLFDPAWGPFDLACGSRVTSVFGGTADRKAYLAATGGFDQPPQFPKTNLTEANRALNELYARVRAYREAGKKDLPALTAIVQELDRTHPSDWLLRYELLELDRTQGLSAPWAAGIRRRLDEIAAAAADEKGMITRGLALL